MQELYVAIPDPDAVLALQPEDFGATMLFLLRARGGSCRLHDWGCDRNIRLILAT